MTKRACVQVPFQADIAEQGSPHCPALWQPPEKFLGQALRRGRGPCGLPLTVTLSLTRSEAGTRHVASSCQEGFSLSDQMEI